MVYPKILLIDSHRSFNPNICAPTLQDTSHGTQGRIRTLPWLVWGGDRHACAARLGLLYALLLCSSAVLISLAHWLTDIARFAYFSRVDSFAALAHMFAHAAPLQSSGFVIPLVRQCLFQGGMLRSCAHAGASRGLDTGTRSLWSAWRWGAGRRTKPVRVTDVSNNRNFDW
jgi:hypothetical protein